MKKIMCPETMFIVLLWLILATPQNVYAYLDPGTGSFIFQMAIAGIVGASFTIKIYFKKIKAFFTKFFSKDSQIGKDNE